VEVEVQWHFSDTGLSCAQNKEKKLVNTAVNELIFLN
jgi:hypothetical protein